MTNRSVSKVNDEWFADEEKVRRLVGLLEYPVPLPDAKEVIFPSWNYVAFCFCTPFAKCQGYIFFTLYEKFLLGAVLERFFFPPPMDH